MILLPKGMSAISTHITFCSLIFMTYSLADDPLVVDTTAGKVRGFTSSSRSGRQYLSFKGIPFAKPPVGQLRFKPPQEPESWSGVKNATDDGPWCTQFAFPVSPPEARGEEDCLYLSVYTHQTNSKAPVIVHIHGGAWEWGSKSSFSPVFLMDHDLVIVNINYRLGVLGFLTFEDAEIPGNLGMKDQVMALRWVQKNIARFGGDPNRVTLVGESAGGASVYHHIVSPLSRGLFHGGIAESGTSYNLWAVSPPGSARSRALKLAGMFSCPQESTKAAKDCLMTKDAGELTLRILDFWEWQIDPLVVFNPVVETPGPEAFLIGPINSWQHAPVPLLIGTTSAEGLMRTSLFLHPDFDYKWYDENFEKVMPASIMYHNTASNTREVTKEVRDFYFGKRQISEAEWANLTNMYSDGWFSNGIFYGADKHTGDVYFYYFDYLGDHSLGPKNRSLLIGSSHVEEILYIWNYKNFSFNGQDKEISEKIVRIWADFATNGKAVSPDDSQIWGKWTPGRHHYLHISNSGFWPKEGLNEERYNFWKNLKYRDNYE